MNVQLIFKLSRLIVHNTNSTKSRRFTLIAIHGGTKIRPLSVNRIQSVGYTLR